MPVGNRANIDPDFINRYGFNFHNSTFLGEGRYGKVFLLLDGRVIKIFRDIDSCIHECLILESVKGSPHFPRVYECRDNYIIREFVGGVCITDYIRKNGLSTKLAVNLIELIEDFQKLGFTRLDIRCSHIFVQPDESLKVIDPRRHYDINLPYPKNMLNNLKKLKVKKFFMHVLKKEHPSLYAKWRTAA